jgi:hypothetical protein
MHLAANFGNLHIVKFLLQQDGYGAYRRGGYGPYNVRLDEANRDGLTPLQVAERNGFVEIAELIRTNQIQREELVRKERSEEDARKIEEAKRAKMIAATRERTLKELELQGKRHYAICGNCGVAHEKPEFRLEQARDFWYCKTCGSCLGRYDLYEGGTVVSLRPRFPPL